MMKCPHCYQEIARQSTPPDEPVNARLMALADAAIAYASDNIDLGDLRRIALDYAAGVKKR